MQKNKSTSKNCTSWRNQEHITKKSSENKEWNEIEYLNKDKLNESEKSLCVKKPFHNMRKYKTTSDVPSKPITLHDPSLVLRY